MPKLSMYRTNRTRDYQFLDRIIGEQYTVGGLDLYCHKYLGPETGGADSAFSGNADATLPIYETLSPLNIQDLLLLENRDRQYDPDIYVMRGVYNAQDIDFDLTQFGLFLNNDTLFITFHYNKMIDTFGRKLMNGDVLEIPNLKDFHPLKADLPTGLARYYVIQDAAYASEGFSVTWLPHLWRVKATPLTDSQEFNTITNKPMVSEQIWDNGNFYPTGSVVNYGNTYYQARANTPSGTDITNTSYWREYTPPTIADLQGTRLKDTNINEAILTQADIEVPLSGYDVSKFYILPTENLQPANSTTLFADSQNTVDGTQGGMDVTPQSQGYTEGYLTGTPTSLGYTVGYLTGSDEAPNGLPVTPGVTFPLNPSLGDYALRLDYQPNRLFRYDGVRWVKLEDAVRTNLNNGSANDILKSTFVNNTYTVPTTDMGNIPSRQSLSEMLKPRADNGDNGGDLPTKPFPPTQPGQKSS